MSKKTKLELKIELANMTEDDNEETLRIHMNSIGYRQLKKLQSENKQLKNENDILSGEIIAYKKMTEEKEILFDELENARNQVDELEYDISQLQEKNEIIDELTDLIDRLSLARSRYAMGILSELEEIEKLTDQIIDIGV